MLRIFWSFSSICFIYSFMFQMITGNNTVQQSFYLPSERHCYIKMISAIFRTNLVQNWWYSLKMSIFSMVLGLRINSATWLMRFLFKSSAMDTRYLFSLVTHLNWPRSLENLSAASSLQQFQVKSSKNAHELKWHSDTAKYLGKQNLACSPHVPIEPMLEWSFIIELENKAYCTSGFMYIETIEVFGNSDPGGADQRSCSFWPTEALAKHWY